MFHREVSQTLWLPELTICVTSVCIWWAWKVELNGLASAHAFFLSIWMWFCNLSMFAYLHTIVFYSLCNFVCNKKLYSILNEREPFFASFIRGKFFLVCKSLQDLQLDYSQAKTLLLVQCSVKNSEPMCTVKWCNTFSSDTTHELIYNSWWLMGCRVDARTWRPSQDEAVCGYGTSDSLCHINLFVACKPDCCCRGQHLLARNELQFGCPHGCQSDTIGDNVKEWKSGVVAHTQPVCVANLNLS